MRETIISNFRQMPFGLKFIYFICASNGVTHFLAAVLPFDKYVNAEWMPFTEFWQFGYGGVFLLIGLFNLLNCYGMIKRKLWVRFFLTFYVFIHISFEKIIFWNFDYSLGEIFNALVTMMFYGAYQIFFYSVSDYFEGKNFSK